MNPLTDLVEPDGSAAVVVSAYEAGLVDSLARPATPDELAERLGLDPEATRLTLDALVAIGVAVKSKGRFGASTAASAARQGAPSSGARPRLPEDAGTLWGHLPRFLRTGERIAAMDGSAEERASAYKDVVPALAGIFEETALELAVSLDAPRGEILDVGAGSGVWSLAMAERSPSARVTAVDLPDVIPAFLVRAEGLGLSDRVATIPGDYLSVELPRGRYERVVLANVLHLETPEHARALVGRVAPALRSGGELVVVDALAEGGPENDRSVAAYALHLAMRTSTGRIHPRAEIEGWCREAGLDEGELVVPDAPLRMLAALVHRTPQSAGTPS